MDALVVVRGRPGLVPQTARYQGRRSGRRRHARDPGGSGIEGTRPAGVRVHEQRHLVGTSGGDRRPANGGAHSAALASRTEDDRRGWPVVVHTGGSVPLAKLIRAGYVQALLSGNALGVHDIEAAHLRHIARSAAGRRPAGRARPPQPHARHQRDQPLRRHHGRGRMRAADQRRHVRMREEQCAVRAGGQPSRRWSAARHRYRHECRAGSLRRST